MLTSFVSTKTCLISINCYSYVSGIRFDGTKEDRRIQEKEANLRVKGLQIQQDDIYHDKSAIETALNIARTQPNQQSKFAVNFFV